MNDGPDHDGVKKWLDLSRGHSRHDGECRCPAHATHVHYDLYEMHRRSLFLTQALQALDTFTSQIAMTQESEDGGISRVLRIFVDREDWWMARSIALDAKSLGWIEGKK